MVIKLKAMPKDAVLRKFVKMMLERQKSAVGGSFEVDTKLGISLIEKLPNSFEKVA